MVDLALVTALLSMKPATISNKPATMNQIPIAAASRVAGQAYGHPDPFSGSLGVHRGPTCTVKLSFHPQVSASVKERTWHASQQFKDRADGSVVMTLEVSDDYALRSWILGFGRFVRVLAPATLVGWVRDELEQTREQYESGEITVDESAAQARLPFLFDRLASA